MKTQQHNSQPAPSRTRRQSLVSGEKKNQMEKKVAGRMLINRTGFECVWPCVGQKEPWDIETQQNWHWKQTDKKNMREGGRRKGGKRKRRREEGRRRNKYLISSRGRSKWH